MEREKALENIVSGIDRFFNEKFPPSTNEKFSYNINPQLDLDKHTYSMEYKGNHYFLLVDSDYNLNIEIELKEKNESLKQKLEVYRTPNEKLNKTKYLRNQEIEFVDDKIKINCRINKYPLANKEIIEFCDNLWQYVIKNVMLSVG